MNQAKTVGTVIASAIFVAALVAGCSDKPEALVAQAKESLAKHDRNAAVIHLKSALQVEPDNAEARLLLGNALLEQGDPVSAEKELRRARDLKLPDDRVVPTLARAMIVMNEPRKVIEEFGQVKLGTPEARADLAAALAQANMITGNSETARNLYAQALKEVPGHAAATLGEALVAANSGDRAGAMKMVESVIAKSPNVAEAWHLKGDIAAAQGQADDAIAAYRKSLELRPEQLLAHVRIASILIQQGKTQEAGEQVAAMKKLAPRHPQTLYLQALLAFREKNYTAAREAIQLQLRAAPDNLSGLVLAGSIEYSLGSYGQAEVVLQKALAQAPKHNVARMMLVNTYLRNGQAAKAMDTMKPLLEEGSENANVLALAGEVYMRNGLTAEAEKVFAKSAQLDPKDTNKRTALALTHLSSGDADRGYRELEQAAADDPGIRADLALIATNTQQRRWDAALKAIDDVEKKQPDKALPHSLRGAVYAAKGDNAAARKSFERALQVEPTDFAATASLARLDLNDKKPDDARKRFEGLLAKDPKNTRALLAVADLRSQAGGSTDEVAALIGKAVAADPTSVVARVALISYYLRSKEPKKAVAAAQDALAVMPDRAELLDAAGQAQLAAGDANQALATFTKLAAARPGQPEGYIRMAGAQMAAKDADGAVQSLKKALALRPDLVDVQRAMIKLNLDAGREGEALAMAREVQKQRPKESSGYLLEGDIYSTRKAWPNAITAYRAGLKNVGTSDLAMRLDAVLRASGNAAEADKDSAVWLKDNPKNREYRMYVAEMAMRKKDWAYAAARYKELLAVNPDDVLALNNLAYVSGQMKDRKALEYGEKAVKLAPSNAAVFDTYGMLLVDNGDTKRGVEYMRRAAELSPVSNAIRLNLARALIKDGQQAAADKELEALAKLGDRFSEQAQVAKLRNQLPAAPEVAKDREEAARDVERLQKTVAAAPNAPAMRLKLAQALIKAGQTDAARKELEILAKLGPKFEDQAEVAKLMRSL